MDIEELYNGLRRIQDRGEIGNAYSGCGTVVSDTNVLDDFFEYIIDKYEEPLPPWAEAFAQIYSWQFQTIHECSEAYYTNLYGNSEYKTIIKTADYLRENGYSEIVKPYSCAAIDCKDGQYPEDKAYLLPDDWIDNNEEIVWNFYVDILEKHKEELL